MNNRNDPTPASDKQLLHAATQFAYSLTRNLVDAEDLAQQAWMKLQRKYGRVENRNVLFVTIRNTHYDQLRRNRVVSFSSLDTAPEPYRADTPGHGLDITVALAALTKPERLTIQMNVMEGRTANEIGEKLGMPRGTVLSHMSRARKKLRETFGSEMGYPQSHVA